MWGKNNIKADKYLRRHDTRKKWLSVMLCVALLTGTLSMYILNKPATAMTEEGAESIGVVMDTANAGGEDTKADTGSSFWEPIPEEELPASDTEADSSENADAENTDNAGEASDNEDATAADSSEAASDAVAAEGSESADATTTSEDAAAAEGSESADASEAAGEETSDNGDVAQEGTSDDSEIGASDAAQDGISDAADTLSSDAEVKESEKKASDITTEIPESVDLAEYVTETIIERLNEDGEWEVIDKEDIVEGDQLRITINYVLPAQAAASEDIHYDLPKMYGTADEQKSELEDGNGNYEVKEDNQITVEYNEEYIKEVTESESTDTNDNADTNESADAVNDAANDSAALSGVSGFFQAFIGGFSIVAHAASENDSQQMIPGQLRLTATVTNMVVDSADVYKAEYKWYDDGQYLLKPVDELEKVAPPNDVVNKGQKLYFLLKFHVPENTLNDGNKTITYDLGKAGFDNVEPEIDRPIKDSEGNTIGTYTIAEDGKVTFYPNDEYIAKNKTGTLLKGEFDFITQANSSSEKEEDTKEYTFNENIKVTVRILNKVSYTANVYKQENRYDPATGKISYVVRISTGENGTGGPINFKDEIKVLKPNQSEDSELSENLNFDDSSLTEFSLVKKNESGASETINGYAPVKNGKEFTINNLPALNKGEYYEMVYSYTVPDKIRTSIKSVLANKASIEVENVETQPFTVTHEFDSIPKIDKSGTADTTNKTVTWTITLNENHQDLGGYILSDEKISRGANGWEIIKTPEKEEMSYIKYDAAGNETGRGTFKLELQSDGTYGKRFSSGDTDKYVITYTRDYSVLDVEYNGLKNHAEIKLATDPQYKNEKDANVPIEKYDVVEKKSDGYTTSGSTATITWIVTFKPNILRNEGKDNSEYWKYVDTIKDENQVITDSQQRAIKSALSRKFVGDYEITFTGSRTVGSGRNAISGATGFELKVKRDLKEEYTLTYTTSAHIDDANAAVTYKNAGYVYRDEFSSEDSTGQDPLVVKMDGNGTEGPTTHNYYEDDLISNGILTWRIKVTVPKNYNYQYLYVTDTLPENMTFSPTYNVDGKTIYGLEIADNDSFNNSKPFEVKSGWFSSSYEATVRIKNRDVEFSADYYPNSVTIDCDSRNLLSVSQIKDTTFYIRIRAKINDRVFTDAKSTETFDNTVKISSLLNSSIATDSQAQTINKVEEVIDKTGHPTSVDTDITDGYQYEVDINEHAEDLLQNGDVLTLRDTLHSYSQNQFQVNLLLDSVKVYEIGEDNSQTELSTDEYSYIIDDYYSDYEYSTQNYKVNHYSVIEMKIPDEKHLKVVYIYRFTGSKGVQIHLDNSAVLKGVSSENAASHKEENFKIQEDSAHLTAEIEMFKVAAENTSRKLAGAKFKLYKYTVKSGDGTADYSAVSDKDFDYVTGEDGKISVSNLTPNVAYMLKEVGEPDGYMAENKDTYFLIKDKGTALKPDDFARKGGVEYAEGSVVFIRNTKNNTSVNIEKKWEGDLTNMPQSIELIVKRKLIPVDAGSVQTYHKVKILRKDRNNHIQEFIGLPAVETGSKLTFKLGGIRQPGPNGYKEIPGLEINGASIDLTDKFKESYSKQTIYYTIENINSDITIMVSGCNSSQNDVMLDYVLEEPTNTGSSQSGGTTQSDDSQFEMKITMTGDKVTTWNHEITGLKKYVNIDGIIYECKYYIEREIKNLYYDPEITLEMTNDGTLHIKNKRNQMQSYTLPSTGSTGTMPFTVGGLVMLGTAVIGSGLVNRRKREEE
ncbi:SpaA isopeptide-forming pilin-related protein [Butyrivibrio sp. MB2005]|uniref:SpaA isopeptide-forming pilin-related protein n=1 Tax=Butyrivibrio sp. MB2005 TaxID=1280678 RepID=UPI00047D59B0|nr:SpaA isopeptide-forming pilin-related protein [Butyrivibrio sp. MB2005]